MGRFSRSVLQAASRRAQGRAQNSMSDRSMPSTNSVCSVVTLCLPCRPRPHPGTRPRPGRLDVRGRPGLPRAPGADRGRPDRGVVVGVLGCVLVVLGLDVVVVMGLVVVLFAVPPHPVPPPPCTPPAPTPCLKVHESD